MKKIQIKKSGLSVPIRVFNLDEIEDVITNNKEEVFLVLKNSDLYHLCYQGYNQIKNSLKSLKEKDFTLLTLFICKRNFFIESKIE